MSPVESRPVESYECSLSLQITYLSFVETPNVKANNQHPKNSTTNDKCSSLLFYKHPAVRKPYSLHARGLGIPLIEPILMAHAK